MGTQHWWEEQVLSHYVKWKIHLHLSSSGWLVRASYSSMLMWKHWLRLESISTYGSVLSAHRCSLLTYSLLTCLHYRLLPTYGLSHIRPKLFAFTKHSLSLLYLTETLGLYSPGHPRTMTLSTTFVQEPPQLRLLHPSPVLG